MLRFPAQVWQAQPQRQQADNSAAIACLHRAGKLRAQFGQETWPALCCSLAFFLPCNSGSGGERGPRAAHCLRRAGNKRAQLPLRAALNLYLTNHQYIVCPWLKYAQFFQRGSHVGFGVVVFVVLQLLYLLRVAPRLIGFRVFLSRLTPGPPHGRAMARPPRARATMRPCCAATAGQPCLSLLFAPLRCCGCPFVAACAHSGHALHWPLPPAPPRAGWHVLASKSWPAPCSPAPR